MARTITGEKRKASDGEAAPPAKRQRGNGGKKAVKKGEVAPPPAQPKRINKALKNKIKQVDDFFEQTTGSVLARDDEDRAVVSEAALLATLMEMRADWEISDPRLASLLDVQEINVGSFVRPLGTMQVPANFVILDLSKPTAFHDGIQLKIKGHGLEDINLLKVQLEMHHRQIEANAAAALADAVANVPSGSEDEREQTPASTGDAIKAAPTDDFAVQDTTELANDTIEGAVVEIAEQATSKDASKPSVDTDTSPFPDKEIGTTGVCPAPSKDL